MHGRDASALVRAADVAMYEAKARKTGVVTYDPDLDVNTPTRLALLGDLRRALQEDQLLLHYQPKVDLDTGHVSGVEALVRWQHPERGLVPPGEFVPVAEGTGLILPLTLRTLELAVAQARQWLDDGRPVQVAVNLSPRCLLEPDFRGRRAGGPGAAPAARPAAPPRDHREQHHGRPGQGPGRADEPARGRGVACRSTTSAPATPRMAYLKRLPVDELKIDRSFVMEMTGSSSDSVLVRSSIDLGPQPRPVGRRRGRRGRRHRATPWPAWAATSLQGYHLARPMDAAAATAWLSSHAQARPVPVAP